ncbi:TetR/AcrR family transcriptional regulator [Streptomyces bambusae]|uniref:TetR family transcriptional regulator n=1 Tax=Streptomyces bambusae TaxID=1550616 RepID=A0ABS6Z610_9ACTN|nr:TetR/AcrR family transcriptional regulator [Streptomyces bambusae]MBW5482150.1 TetR family transcriptional regulator [Streptomyces bambusae]
MSLSNSAGSDEESRGTGDGPRSTGEDARSTAENAPSIDDKILDAAAELVAVLGKRVQLAEIARRAGVSRPTVYRRWPDVRAVVGSLLTREIMRTVERTPRTGDDLAGLVEWIVDVAVQLRDHPVLGGLLADGDLLTEYVVQRLGTSQRTLLSLLRDAVEAGQRGGTVRPGEPMQLASMVLLITQSTVQSHRMVAELLPEPAWRSELALALNGYLRP